jgi:hypothetical protein
MEAGEGMSAKPFLVATGLALLCAGWVQASTVPPSPYFTIQLTGWDGEEAFTATSNSTFSPSEEDGFSQNVLCPADDWECLCHDPRAILNGGGDPIDFDGSYNFQTNADGNVTLQFENVGPNIESFLITTTITPAQEGETFTCSSNLFAFCGFEDPAGAAGETLEILFTDPINPFGIPTAAPEPSQYAVLLLALVGGIAAHRIRAQRARSQATSDRIE